MSSIDIVHKFAPFDVYPWRMDGSVLMMEIVPGLWVVTPFSPGWKTVVYSPSAILITLTSVVGRLVMYRTSVLMYRMIVLLARPTKVRR